MSNSAPPPPNEIEIKYEKQDNGTYVCYDNTGWSTVATEKKFAKAVVERRARTMGKIR